MCLLVRAFLQSLLSTSGWRWWAAPVGAPCVFEIQFRGRWAANGELESLLQILARSLSVGSKGCGPWSSGRVDVEYSVVLQASADESCEWPCCLLPLGAHHRRRVRGCHSRLEQEYAVVSIANPLPLFRIQPVDGRFPPGIAERDVYGFGVLSERDREAAFAEGMQGAVDERLRRGAVAGGIAAPGQVVPQRRQPLLAPGSLWVVDESEGSQRVGGTILVPVGVRVVHGRASVADGDRAVCAPKVSEGYRLTARRGRDPSSNARRQRSLTWKNGGSAGDPVELALRAPV